MRTLNSTKAAWNLSSVPVKVVKVAAAGVLVMAALALIIAVRPGPSASTSSASTRSGLASGPAQQPSQAQAALFAYWAETDGLESRVMLNNASNTELTIQPTLFNLSGQPLVIRPVTLPPLRQLTINIADWLGQAAADDSFKQGNLILQFEAPDATYLGAQLIVTNPASSLSFDVRNEMPMSFESSRLEGVWWRPNEASRYDLILSNMQESGVEVRVAVSDGQRLGDDAVLNLNLAPHQTEVINLGDEKNGLAANSREMGTVSITHTGSPGAVVAFGMLSEDKKGFSSRFVFEDPAAGRSQRLVAAHIMIGEPDVPGFSAGTRFTTVALVGNAGEETMEVTPEVSFMLNKEPRSVKLRTRRLERHEIKAIDVGEEMRQKGIVGAIKGAGLSLRHTGHPGTLVAQLTSHDQTGNHVFDVPLKDMGIPMNRQGGNHPWNIAGETQSIIHVRNTTDEKASFTIQLNFVGGSYALPLQMVAPQQEVAIDIRQLRDNQTPDSIGRVIPKEVTHGQVIWHAHGPQPVTGRAEVFNTRGAIASSFSCPADPPCCGVSTEIFCTPSSLQGGPGQISLISLMEVQRDCNLRQLGPFDVTQSAVWSSTNTSVARMSGAGRVEYLAPGTAGIIANLDVEERGPGCDIFFNTLTAVASVTINPRIDSITPTRGLIGSTTIVTINGAGMASGATINAGAGISVSNIVVRSAQEIQANFNVAADAPGGNHSVTVTVNGLTSNSVNFFVQVATRLRRDSISGLMDELGGGCGAFRNIDYTLVDQQNPGQPIEINDTIMEVLSNFTATDPRIPNLTADDNTSVSLDEGRVRDVMGYNIPTCPPPFTMEFDQTFVVKIGSNSIPLTTKNHSRSGRTAAGTKFVDVTITNP